MLGSRPICKTQRFGQVENDGVSQQTSQNILVDPTSLNSNGLSANHTYFAFSATVMASSVVIPSPFPAAITRRNLLLSTTIATVSPSQTPPTLPSPDTTITDRVFLDFAVCPTYFRSDSSSSAAVTASSSPPCAESTPLGRLVLGLYGRQVPITVSTFKQMCISPNSSYKNTAIHKILPGRYFVAGRQGGRREKDELSPQISDLPRNTDIVDSRAFLLPHARAGVVSLCLSENDDDEERRLDLDYRNVEFLITTGPGPCPDLDGGNIVFGTVLEGQIPSVVSNSAALVYNLTYNGD